MTPEQAKVLLDFFDIRSLFEVNTKYIQRMHPEVIEAYMALLKLAEGGPLVSDCVIWEDVAEQEQEDEG